MLRERHLQIIWSWWDLYFFLFASWFLELGVRTPDFSYQKKVSLGCPGHETREAADTVVQWTGDEF